MNKEQQLKKDQRDALKIFYNTEIGGRVTVNVYVRNEFFKIIKGNSILSKKASAKLFRFEVNPDGTHTIIRMI